MKRKRRTLVFVDDDRTELDAIRELLGSRYEVRTIHWPHERVDVDRPDIFVLDLYLPTGASDKQLSDEDIEQQGGRARRVADGFNMLYPDQARDGKKLLQKTMECLTQARSLLDEQVKALGQSPKNGLRLLADLKKRYRGVPVVFYSRKITPEDVVTTLRAGAVDAIRKGVPANELIVRLDNALQVYASAKSLRARRAGLNVNITLS